MTNTDIIMTAGITAIILGCLGMTLGLAVLGYPWAMSESRKPSFEKDHASGKNLRTFAKFLVQENVSWTSRKKWVIASQDRISTVVFMEPRDGFVVVGIVETNGRALIIFRDEIRRIDISESHGFEKMLLFDPAVAEGAWKVFGANKKYIDPCIQAAAANSMIILRFKAETARLLWHRLDDENYAPLREEDLMFRVFDAAATQH